jgi:hypothetical protein
MGMELIEVYEDGRGWILGCSMVRQECRITGYDLKVDWRSRMVVRRRRRMGSEHGMKLPDIVCGF